MSLSLYQIVIVAFAFMMMFHGIKSFLQNQSGQTLLKLAVRLLVWGGMALIVLFPNLSNTLASVIGIEGNINAVILVGFLLVFLLIFKLLSAIEKLEQQITTLTRQESLKDLEK